MAQSLFTDDDAWKIIYREYMSLILFAFACGLRRSFATHEHKWKYCKFSVDGNLSVHPRSSVDYRTNSIAFCHKELNENMLRAGHCTTLEALAFGGLSLIVQLASL